MKTRQSRNPVRGEWKSDQGPNRARKFLRSDPRRGAAAVEFALVIPFLLAIVLGLVEFGQAFKVQAAMARASQAGCEAGAGLYGTNTRVINEVRAAVNAAGLPGSNATVSIFVNGVPGDVASAVRNDAIRVTVSMPTNATRVASLVRFIPSSGTVSQSTTMMKQD
jgi:Flp pilus assembly protein TadG